jgi:hypothetical protein
LITTTGQNKLAESLLSMISHARYTVDGVANDIPIHSTKITNNAVSIYILFDNNYEGNITKVELIDTDDEVFATQTDNIQKVDTKLLLVTFKFTLAEVVS